MFMLVGASFLCAMTIVALREGLLTNGRGHITGYDTEALMMGGLAVLAAVYFLGPLYGIALVLSVMMHEYGHVAAFRIIGHDDARFRLIPLMGGVAISDRLPATQLDDFFVTLLGPGICLAPMVMGFVLADLSQPISPAASEFFWVFATVTGALNFFNLLPFWPLDGGRCMRIIANSFSPALAPSIAISMCACLGVFGLITHSLVLFGFALFGAYTLIATPDTSKYQTPLTYAQALLGFTAWGFALAAHFLGGYALIMGFL